MDGHGNAYRDYFSQAGSSSADSAAAAAAADDDDFGLSFQAPSYLPAAPNLSSPRVHVENLDLNSQADSFPFLDAYSGYLQPDGGHCDDGLPPLGRGGRSRHGAFLPPRPSGAGSRGRRCNSLNIGSGSGRLPLGSGPGIGGGGRGRSLANRVGRGSTGAPSSSFPPEDAGGHDGIEEEDDNGSPKEMAFDVETQAAFASAARCGAPRSVTPHSESRPPPPVGCAVRRTAQPKRALSQIQQYVKRCRKRRQIAVTGALLAIVYYLEEEEPHLL